MIYVIFLNAMNFVCVFVFLFQKKFLGIYDIDARV